jgi:hypothetical protein
MAAKFRKKPVVIEAIVAGPDIEVYRFLSKASALRTNGGFNIKTLEGTMFAADGDWIIKGVKGEFYPCKPDIFAATYEAVLD